MFEQRDYRVYKDIARADIYESACVWWGTQGFYVTRVGPYHVRGVSYYSKIGLRREFDLFLNEAEGGTTLDLTFRAQITDEGLVGGAVAAVLVWPVAVVGGAISYHEYEKEARQLMYYFWQFMDQEAGVPGAVATPTTPPPVPPPPPPQPPAAAPNVPCGECGALLHPDWKACPYCGERLEG